MRRWRIAVGVTLLIVALALCDPLARFSVEQSYASLTNPLWCNGFFGAIDQSESARPIDVLHAYLALSHQRKGEPAADILEIRPALILGSYQPFYWAAMVHRAEGKSVVIFQFCNQPQLIHPEKVGYWYVRDEAP